MRSVWALPSKPPQSAAELVERHLAVVPERRVAHVVRERGGLGEVGVAAERVGEVAGDLGDLEAVGEAVADEVVGLRTEHLGLGREPAQRGRVHDPGPVALEGRAHGRLDPLGRLLDETLARGVVVEVVPGSRSATLVVTAVRQVVTGVRASRCPRRW